MTKAARRQKDPSRFRQPAGWVRYYITVICRHWGLFLPILFVMPMAIVGGLGRGLGVQYLFRDAVNPFDIAYSQPDWWWQLPVRLFSSAYFETQSYAVALIGLMWTTSLLLEDRFSRLERVYLPNEARIFHYLPGIALLALLPLGAALFQLGLQVRSGNAHWLLLLLPVGGYVGGLIFFYAMSKFAFLVARYVKRPKIEVVLVITCLVIIAAVFFPLVLPAKLLFVILAAIVVAYAALQLLGPTARVGAIGLVLLAGIAANTLRSQKYTFPGLEAYYDAALDNRPNILRGFANRRASDAIARQFSLAPAAPICSAGNQGIGSGLIDPVLNLQHWYDHVTSGSPVPQAGQPVRKPKLVIVATSGGAYRATYWTARVLETVLSDDRLGGDLPGFRKSIRLLTGASGGMVGSAYFAVSDPAASSIPHFAAEIRDDIKAAFEGGSVWRNPLASDWDSLSLVSRQLVLGDMPAFLSPFTRDYDRGRELEKHWKRLDRTFGSIRDDEARGVRPSLVLTPTLADNGVPLIVSNIDLDTLYHKSKEAVQLFRLLDGPQGRPPSQDKLKIATAVRMSATFPFISPATRLPSATRDRVIDAGYYDNFGIDVAVAYLHEPAIMAWLKSCTSGVLVMQIHAWRAEITDSVPSRSWLTRWLSAFEWLTTPLEGVASARASTNYIHNRREFCELQDIYRDPALPRRIGDQCQNDDDFLQTFTIEPDKLDEDATFTWNLQPSEIADMEIKLGHKSVANVRKELADFWKSDLKSSPVK